MKLSRSFLGLLVFAGCTRCSAKISTHISFVSRQSDSIANAIPRGGSVALTLDPKAVATVGLSCLLGHCILDIVKPGKVVQLYELDTNQEINSFYFSRIGGWGLTTVSSLLLQMHTKIPYTQAIGYSFLPIASLTLYQLLTDQYQKAGVNQNSGIAAILFQAIHFGATFLDTKLPESIFHGWIQLYMTMLGLSGINLVISAQTVPGISTSTIAILRMLGTVSCYVSTSILSQEWLGWSPLKAVGILMGTLAMTSIPVCLDLKEVSKKNRDTAFSSTSLYLVYILLEIGVAAYLLRS